jgi:site-specific DNA-methyltransferase (adenine-specific)
MTRSSEHTGFRGAEGPGWRLYHGDCLPVLRSLPDGCLDAVITDPPYCSGGWSAAQRRRPPEAKYQESDRQPSFAGDQRDQRGFVAWSLLWLEQCYRAMKADRPLLVFIDWRNLPALSDAVQAAGFVWRSVVVWDKTEACRPQQNGFRNQTEFVIYATKGGIPPINPPVYLPGVIRCPAPRERIHMTEKPISLLAQLVQLAPKHGTVCDPFTGSATTGVAALSLHRAFLGCEMTLEYHGLAAERLEHVRAGA